MRAGKEIVLFNIKKEDLEVALKTLLNIKSNINCYFIIYINNLTSFEGFDLPSDCCGTRESFLGAPGMLLESGNVYVVHNKLNIFTEDELFLTEMSNDIFFNSLFKNQIFSSIFFFNEIDDNFLLSLRKVGNFSSNVFLEESIYQNYKDTHDFQILPLIDSSFQTSELPHMIESLFEDVVCGVSDEHIEKLISVIKKESFVDLSYYKREKIEETLCHRFKVTGCKSSVEYLELLKSSLEWQLFNREIFNSGSDFFSNRERQEEIKDLLKKIVDAKYDDSIRIWVPGAGTGEEAFYVSAVLDELLQKEGLSFKVQIFATDISEEAVSFGFMPMFSENELVSLDLNLVDKAFVKVGKKYSLKPVVKDRIIFTEQNILEDTPLTNVDMIICNNILSDLNEESLYRVEKIFNMALAIDGFLVTSLDEELELEKEKFTFHNEYKGVYTNNLCKKDCEEVLKDSYEHLSMIETLIMQTIQNLGSDYLVIDKDKKVLLQHGQLIEYFESSEDLIGKEILEYAKESIKYELEKGLMVASEFKNANLERVPYMSEDETIKMLYLNTIPLPDNNIVRDMILIVFSEPSASGGDRHVNRRPSVKFR